MQQTGEVGFSTLDGMRNQMLYNSIWLTIRLTIKRKPNSRPSTALSADSLSLLNEPSDRII